MDHGTGMTKTGIYCQLLPRFSNCLKMTRIDLSEGEFSHYLGFWHPDFSGPGFWYQNSHTRRKLSTPYVRMKSFRLESGSGAPHTRMKDSSHPEDFWSTLHVCEEPPPVSERFGAVRRSKSRTMTEAPGASGAVGAHDSMTARRSNGTSTA